ncbi:CD63 antigen-like [Aplysia californica]|uniref:CD63 antigen-like n=1 Tax=Aplysia californica TaxID=6500 RepID=A0ABM1A5U0_APLCA|nr:CD63 antigen-like [Aplysia californica]
MCGAGIINKELDYIIRMINTKGCMKSFGEWLSKNDAVIGYVCLGVLIPQIIGVVAARFFIKHLRKRRTSWKHLKDKVQIVSEQ